MDEHLTRAKYAQGAEPEPAAYGFNIAEERGLTVSYSRDKPHSKLSQKVFWRFGFDFFHALDNLRRMRQADAIWTMLEWEWLAVSALQRLGFLKKVPVLANSVWLAEQWPQWSPRRRWLVRALMGDNLYLSVHSIRAQKLLAEFLPDKTFHLVPFGISTRGFPLTSPAIRDRSGGPIRVYSIGNDSTRDWQTMLDAFGGDPRFDMAIVCRWLDDERAQGYDNLRVPRVTTLAEQLELYDWADVVIMPMTQNCFSGITVMLEAAARGKPIVASHTGGADTYFDAGEVCFVEPENPTALREALLQMTPQALREVAERGQARFVKSNYSAEAMVDRYIEITRTLLKRPQA